jgi:hypothetical protein
MNNVTIAINLENPDDLCTLGYSDGSVDVEIPADLLENPLDVKVTLTKEFIEHLSELSFEARI